MNADERRFADGHGELNISVYPRASAVDDLNAVSEKIIGCAYEVANGLGAGFLEKVHENALRHELRRTGLAVLQQHLDIGNSRSTSHN